MEPLTTNAVVCGARVAIGGAHITNYFFAPTVLADAPVTARPMNEESFGPIALVAAFRNYEGVTREANRLACGLAAFAWTQSAKTMTNASRDLEAGMASINHRGLAAVRRRQGFRLRLRGRRQRWRPISITSSSPR
jgi:succinate-semialdehyde dehydrogenase/glutarate-semialdehyde dehydrogenase